jgi:hypothetical protein
VSIPVKAIVFAIFMLSPLQCGRNCAPPRHSYGRCRAGSFPPD